MAQISLRRYLELLLNGTKDYIDTENSDLNSVISADYGAAIDKVKEDLMASITALDSAHSNITNILDGRVDSLESTTLTHTTEIANIKTDLDKKLDKDFIIPWANYDATNKILKIGAPGSTFYIKSTTTGLEIYQGTTKIAYFEGGHFKATDITTSNSMTTPKITIGGLEISGNSTNGWSFR